MLIFNHFALKNTISLLFSDYIEYFGYSVEVVARIVIDIYSAFLVVTNKADLGSENKAHPFNEIF